MTSMSHHPDLTATETRKAVAPVLAGLLDWMLPTALAMAALGAGLGGMHLAQHGARWSLGALLFAIYGAFGGATIGATGWASWVVTRRNNLFLGVVAGMLLGLTVNALFVALYQPLAILIIRVPDAILPAMQRGLAEWFIDVRNTGLNVLLVAAMVGCLSRLIPRSQPESELCRGQVQRRGFRAREPQLRA